MSRIFALRSLRRTTALLSLVLWLAFGPSSTRFAQTGDEAELRGLVAKFSEFYAQKDLDRLAALWSQQSPDLAMTRNRLQQSLATVDKLNITIISCQSAGIEGGNAKL